MSTVTQDVLSAGQRIVTMNQLIDEAIDTLPLFRRRMMRLRLSRPRHRHEVCCELQVKLHDDHRVQALGLQPMFASDAFSAETPFRRASPGSDAGSGIRRAVNPESRV